MNTAKILDLKKILTAPKKVVIVPHKNPRTHLSVMQARKISI